MPLGQSVRCLPHAVGEDPREQVRAIPRDGEVLLVTSATIAEPAADGRGSISGAPALPRSEHEHSD